MKQKASLCFFTHGPHLWCNELKSPTLSVLLLLQEAPHLWVVLSHALLSGPSAGAAEASPAQLHHRLPLSAQTSWGPEDEGLHGVVNEHTSFQSTTKFPVTTIKNCPLSQDIIWKKLCQYYLGMPRRKGSYWMYCSIKQISLVNKA